MITMSTLKIRLSDKLNSQAKRRAAERGCKTIDEYVQALIHEDAPAQVSAELEAGLLKCLASPAREFTSADWAEKKRKLRQNHRRAKAG
jgi:hypothetical protein